MPARHNPESGRDFYRGELGLGETYPVLIGYGLDASQCRALKEVLRLQNAGGIAGSVDVAFGEPTQAPNDYLQAKIGTPQPAYRGVLGLVLRQIYLAANNPYVKPWAVRVKRCFRDWYAAKAEIAGAANPAHILYECLTNAAWGMGYPIASIDGASFQAAADTLAAEGFGLNLLWLQQSKIEQFVGDF